MYTPFNVSLCRHKQHDCDVNNVIVFSGLIGVNTSNGGNRIQGVHTWNLAGAQGGIGILLNQGGGPSNTFEIKMAQHLEYMRHDEPTAV